MISDLIQVAACPAQYWYSYKAAPITVMSESRIYLNAIRSCCMELALRRKRGEDDSSLPRALWSIKARSYLRKLPREGSKTLLISKGIEVLAGWDKLLLENEIVSINPQVTIEPFGVYRPPIKLKDSRSEFLVDFCTSFIINRTKLERWLTVQQVVLRLSKYPWRLFSLISGKPSDKGESLNRKKDLDILLGLMEHKKIIEEGNYYPSYSSACKICPYRHSCESEYIAGRKDSRG